MTGDRRGGAHIPPTFRPHHAREDVALVQVCRSRTDL